MRLLIVLPFLAVGLVGCGNHLPGGTDPFFGRTTVAPPATGSAATSDPAYSSRGLAATAASPIAPSAPPPSLFSPSNMPLNIAPVAAAPINPVTATSNTTYTPYANPYAAGSRMGFASSTVRPAGARLSSPASGLGHSGPGPKMTRTRVTPLSLADNRNNLSPGIPSPGRNTTHSFSTPSARAGSWTNPNWTNPNRTAPNRTAPRRISPPGNVIDIMDLPPKSSGGFSSTGAAGSAASVHRDSAVRLASATTAEPLPSEPLPSTQATNPYSSRLPESNKPISFTPSAKYGHADNHAWLKGRLEYSQARRRWKLRYIPIDGRTDRFGGSVILQKTSLLSGYERGDYVEAKGRLANDAKTAGDYAPDYAVTQIKRVGR